MVAGRPLGAYGICTGKEEMGPQASVVAVGMEGKGGVGEVACRSNGNGLIGGAAREREASRKSPR